MDMNEEQNVPVVPPDSRNTLVIVPAYNEEACIAETIADIRRCLPGTAVLVVDDGSTDRTSALAREAGAMALTLPCNLGVGGAVQAGFVFAAEKRYRYVVRLDADGQHPPGVLRDLLNALHMSGVDMVVGSRFLGETAYRGTGVRHVGIRCLACFLSLICRQRVTDPTSGLYAIDRKLLFFFARSYPSEYPEPEALALLRRQGYEFLEIPASFQPRRHGVSSIDGWGTFYYMVKVFLALVVDRARPVDPQYARANLAGREWGTAV